MTDIVGGSLVSSNGQITSLSQLTEANTLTMEQLVQLKNRILIRIANLVSQGLDYTEHGDTGHTVSLSGTLNALRGQVDMINKMLKDDTLVDPSVLAVLVSEYNNPYL